MTGVIMSRILQDSLFDAIIYRLKARSSKRVLPVVEYARAAMGEAVINADREYLFPRYIRDGKCKADHASAALNKCLKKDFDGLMHIASGIPSEAV